MQQFYDELLRNTVVKDTATTFILTETKLIMQIKVNVHFE